MTGCLMALRPYIHGISAFVCSLSYFRAPTSVSVWTLLRRLRELTIIDSISARKSTYDMEELTGSRPRSKPDSATTGYPHPLHSTVYASGIGLRVSVWPLRARVLQSQEGFGSWPFRTWLLKRRATSSVVNAGSVRLGRWK